jgi:DNA-binding Lrp family transcriptional regulator
MTHSDTDYRLDELDKRILHALMQDGRNTTASSIAERANVSGATVRNRIHNLEDHGIIRGYSAHVDFERAGSKLTNLYLCNVPVAERESLAHEARAIPGVIHVRSLMTGRRNLHVLAIGDDAKDLKQVARSLSQLGIEIEDEDLIEDELFDPYTPFNPDETVAAPELNDFISLTGESNVVEVAVDSNAPVVGLSLEEASRKEIIGDQTLVIGIERGDQELTPKGDTVIESDDILTVLSRSEADLESLEPFHRTQDQTTPD